MREKDWKDSSEVEIPKDSKMKIQKNAKQRALYVVKGHDQFDESRNRSRNR